MAKAMVFVAFGNFVNVFGRNDSFDDCFHDIIVENSKSQNFMAMEIMGEAIMGEAIMAVEIMGEAIMGEAIMGEAIMALEISIMSGAIMASRPRQSWHQGRGDHGIKAEATMALEPGDIAVFHCQFRFLIFQSIRQV